MKIKIKFIITAIAIAFSVNVFSQIKPSLNVALVSKYIWRGQDLGGVSIQPTLQLNSGGFYVGAFGSVGFEEANNKELDLYAGYTYKLLTIGFTDYYSTSTGAEYGKWDFGHGNHVGEVGLGLDFKLFALNGYTNVYGDKDYSPYIELSSPFRLGDLNFKAYAGVVPIESKYYKTDGFGLTNLSLRAEKQVKGFPVFGQVVFNTAADAAYFVAGVTF